MLPGMMPTEEELEVRIPALMQQCLQHRQECLKALEGDPDRPTPEHWALDQAWTIHNLAALQITVEKLADLVARLAIGVPRTPGGPAA